MTTTTRPKKIYPDNSVLIGAVEEYLDAMDRDASDEEIRVIMKKIPISPRRALFLKKFYGKEFVTREFNISEADAALGEGWLDA